MGEWGLAVRAAAAAVSLHLCVVEQSHWAVEQLAHSFMFIYCTCTCTLYIQSWNYIYMYMYIYSVNANVNTACYIATSNTTCPQFHVHILYMHAYMHVYMYIVYTVMELHILAKEVQMYNGNPATHVHVILLHVHVYIRIHTCACTMCTVWMCIYIYTRGYSIQCTYKRIYM